MPLRQRRYLFRKPPRYGAAKSLAVLFAAALIILATLVLVFQNDQQTAETSPVLTSEDLAVALSRDKGKTP